VKHGCEACRTKGLFHRIERDGLCNWHRFGIRPWKALDDAHAARMLGPSYKLDPRRFRDTFGGRA
jgi:hypothetical protein